MDKKEKNALLNKFNQELNNDKDKSSIKDDKNIEKKKEERKNLFEELINSNYVLSSYNESLDLEDTNSNSYFNEPSYNENNSLRSSNLNSENELNLYSTNINTSKVLQENKGNDVYAMDAVYLMMSLSGVENQERLLEEQILLRSSFSYRKLYENCLFAKKYNTVSSNKLVNDFNNLSYTVDTFKELYALKIKVDALLSVSTPVYYLNPLLNNSEYDLNITSIGDLIISYNKGFCTYNEMIKDNTKSDKYKIEAVNKMCIKYHSELVKYTERNCRKIRETNTLKQFFGKSNIAFFISSLIFLFNNIFLIFVLTLSDPLIIDAFYNIRFNSIYSYITYVPLIATLISDILFVAFHLVRSKLYSVYNYARRFLKHKESEVFASLMKKTLKLKEYIVDHIVKKTVFAYDIDMFVREYDLVSFDDVNSLRKNIKENRYYTKLLGSSTFFLILNFIASIFSIICIVLLKAY